MTVKSNVDGEEDSTDTMPVRIQQAQSEPWKSHRFADEDSTECWEVFNENLFIGTEVAFEVGDEDLLAKKPRLMSSLNDAEYLDEISAPMDAAKLSRSQKVKKSRKGKGKEKAGQEAQNGAESDSSTLSDLSGTDGEDDAREEVPEVSKV